VIAPFRAQVALLRKMIANTTGKDVEVNTVDQYQGRDKDIIIFSCTKTDNAPKKSLHTNNKVYPDLLKVYEGGLNLKVQHKITSPYLFSWL
jgi:DNA replication ATP-dependent helicase Dna2